MGVHKSKASPSRGGGTAIAVTERSYQICDNLSGAARQLPWEGSLAAPQEGNIHQNFHRTFY